MVIENLLRSLEKEGREEIISIIQKARERAETIKIRARKAGETRKTALLDEAKQMVVGKRAQTLNRARREVQFEITEARKKLVAGAFEQTKRRFAHLRSERIYPEVLKNLVREALRLLPPRRKLILEIDEEDTELIRQILAELGVTGYELRPGLACLGGLRIRVQGGRTLVDNTIDARLTRAQETFGIGLADSIFGTDK